MNASYIRECHCEKRCVPHGAQIQGIRGMKRLQPACAWACDMPCAMPHSSESRTCLACHGMRCDGFKLSNQVAGNALQWFTRARDRSIQPQHAESYVEHKCLQFGWGIHPGIFALYPSAKRMWHVHFSHGGHVGDNRRAIGQGISGAWAPKKSKGITVHMTRI
jgi:hypothetical protein